MVEPKAAVNIIFKMPDGKTLEDFGYTKYYDGEGGGIETVTVPEGYRRVMSLSRATPLCGGRYP